MGKNQRKQCQKETVKNDDRNLITTHTQTMDGVNVTKGWAAKDLESNMFPNEDY